VKSCPWTTRTHLPHCGLDWRPDRVYFLAFLNPSRDNRIRPLPPGWPVSATVDEPTRRLQDSPLMPLWALRPAVKARVCREVPGQHRP
jgi:hypothetical protein